MSSSPAPLSQHRHTPLSLPLNHLGAAQLGFNSNTSNSTSTTNQTANASNATATNWDSTKAFYSIKYFGVAHGHLGVLTHRKPLLAKKTGGLSDGGKGNNDYQYTSRASVRGSHQRERHKKQIETSNLPTASLRASRIRANPTTNNIKKVNSKSKGVTSVSDESDIEMDEHSSNERGKRVVLEDENGMEMAKVRVHTTMIN